MILQMVSSDGLSIWLIVYFQFCICNHTPSPCSVPRIEFVIAMPGNVMGTTENKFSHLSK